MLLTRKKVEYCCSHYEWIVDGKIAYFGGKEMKYIISDHMFNIFAKYFDYNISSLC